MKRSGKLVLCIMAAVFMFSTIGPAFAADQKAPDEITIKAALWPTPTKAAVKFPHKKHSDEAKIACGECHHKFQDGKNVWKQGDAVDKCEKCHTEATVKEEKKLPPDQQKLNLKLAFHNKCVTCHQKTKKDKPDSKAPVSCAQCHPGGEK